MQMPTKTRTYNWFIAIVAASNMTLYGFDSSVFNALQASDNWLDWFNLDPVRSNSQIHCASHKVGTC